MKWFRDLKLASKLGVAFGLVVMLTLGLGALSILQLAEANHHTGELSANWLPSVKLTAAVKAHLCRYRIHLLLLVLSETDEERGAANAGQAAALADMQQAHTLYKPLICSLEEARANEEFEAALQDYLAVAVRQTQLVADGKSHEARDLAFTEGPQAFAPAGAALDKLVAINEKGADQESRVASASYRHSLYMLMGSILLVFLVSAAVAAFLARLIGGPVRQLAGKASQIAAGDLNQDIAVTSRDEVGMLAGSFLQLKQAVAGLVVETEAIVCAAQQGDLSKRGDADKFQGAYRQLILGFNATLDAVNAPVNEAARVLEQVARCDFSPRVLGAYQGDHAKIKKALNWTLDRLAAATIAQGSSLEAGAKLAAIVEFSDDAIISENLDGSIVSWNQGAERMYGYSAEEVMGRTVSFLLLPEWIDRFATIRNAVRQGQPHRNFDVEFVRKDGRRIEISLTVSPIKDAAGKVIGISKIARDVTERKRTEQALHRSQERLELAVRGSNDGLGDWSLLTNEASWSPRMREMLGYVGDTAGEFEDNFSAVESRMHPDDHDRVIGEISQGVRQHKSVRSEFRIRVRSGEYRWFQGRGQAVYDDAGMPFHFAGALTDITDRKQLEADLAQRDEQLRQAHKLEAVGSLAGGIAHEFNNLLQAIRGYTKYAMEGLQPEDQRYQDLELVLKASDRAATLTRELLGFSRRQVLEQVRLDPSELVTDLVKMLRPLIGEQIDLQVSLAPDTGWLRADRGLLQQMLLNLCINARDAMPSGGRLVLKTQRVELSEKYCETHPGVKPGSYVMFSVADTGVGMSPEVRERIFEPFFTTKGVGKGTGLGLAMVYGCVQQHEGIINVYSEPKLGTTFKIYLPISNAADSGKEVRQIQPVAGGRETILIAEDEPMVRELAVRILSRAGYSVLVAADGAEAVEAFESNAEVVSLALLDAIMPKLTGHQVYDRIKLKNPALPVVFCSGYDPETGQVKLLTDDGVRMVQKPFDPDLLLQVVRAALDEPQLLAASCSD